MRARVLSTVLCIFFLANVSAAQQTQSRRTCVKRQSPGVIPPLLCLPGMVGWVSAWTVYGVTELTDPCDETISSSDSGEQIIDDNPPLSSSDSREQIIDDNPSSRVNVTTVAPPGSPHPANTTLGGGGLPPNPPSDPFPSGPSPMRLVSRNDPSRFLYPGHILVILQSDQPGEKAKLLKEFNLKEKGRYECFSCYWGDRVYLLQIPGPVGIDFTLEVIKKLSADLRFSYVQADYRYLFQSDNQREYECKSTPFSQEIDRQTALAQKLATGRGMEVAVVDSWFDLGHPTLLDKRVTQKLISPDFQSEPSSHALGTILRIKERAPDVAILHVPVSQEPPQDIFHEFMNLIPLQRKESSTWLLLQALDQIIQVRHEDTSRIHVLNLSLSTFSKTDYFVNEMVKNLFTGSVKKCDKVDRNDEELVRKCSNERVRSLARGIPVVVAAGNFGRDQEMYPAALPEALSITAVDNDGNILKNAYQGPSVFVADLGIAPVPKLEVGSDGSPVFGCRIGTSLATAHMSGTIALLLETARDLNPSEVKTYIARGTRPLPQSSVGKSRFGLVMTGWVLEVARDTRQQIASQPYPYR